MANPLSKELREKIVSAYERGEGTIAEVADIFDVSERSVVGCPKPPKIDLFCSPGIGPSAAGLDAAKNTFTGLPASSFTGSKNWEVHSCGFGQPSLDVTFKEDQSRIRIGQASENFSLLRKIALMYLKNETSLKGGIQTKRLRAGWDQKYLLKVLTA